jgi:2-keto-3-deoxy-L-rhamnonate aldolase RhmA
MNKVKQKLSAGQVSIGGWVQIGHPAVVEIMAKAGFDWIAVDNEHGIIDLETGMNLFNAMKTDDVVPVVRVRENNEIVIRRWLDAGAMGVIVPMVNTAEQAKAAVAAAKYPPIGKRGFGYCRGNSYGIEFDNYVKTANDEIIVIVQIEHIDAVKNIDSILSIDGVDGAFIGPYDLSGSMNLTGQISHPDVMKACDEMLIACKKYNKAAGVHVVPVDSEKIKDFANKKFTFIAASLDTVCLRFACERLFD